MKRFALPAVLIGSAFVLTACLDVQADLTVNPDATASGQMTVAISSEVSGFLGLASGVDLVDQIQQGALEGAEGVQDLDCQPAEREGAVAMTCTFENETFDQVDDLWNIYAGDDGTVTFVSTSGEAASEEDAGLLGDLNFDFGGYDIAVEMPGTILSVEGTNVQQTSDTGFRIEAGLNDTFDVVVTSEDGSSSFPTLWLIVGIVGLIVIAIIVFLVLRSRAKNDDTTAIDATPASAVTVQATVIDVVDEPAAMEGETGPKAITNNEADDDPPKE